jgi:hypothetical protein
MKQYGLNSLVFLIFLVGNLIFTGCEKPDSVSKSVEKSSSVEPMENISRPPKMPGELMPVTNGQASGGPSKRPAVDGGEEDAGMESDQGISSGDENGKKRRIREYRDFPPPQPGKPIPIETK